MTNPYSIQLIGILLTVAGIIALIAVTQVYGRPLTHDEQLRVEERLRNAYRLPFNFETMASGALFLAGIGILKWSNFNLCTFLAYWLPNLPSTLRLLLSCR